MSLCLKGTAVLPCNVSLSTLLPFWLGSPCSAPFLSGTAVSPGTRGLSTYLGFLTGPAVGMSWVYLIFSRWTTSFVCTQSTLHDAKNSRGIISYTRSCYCKEQRAAALLVLWERNTLFGLFGMQSRLENRINLLAVTNLRKFPVQIKWVTFSCSNSDDFQRASSVPSIYFSIIIGR